MYQVRLREFYDREAYYDREASYDYYAREVVF